MALIVWTPLTTELGKASIWNAIFTKIIDQVLNGSVDRLNILTRFSVFPLVARMGLPGGVTTEVQRFLVPSAVWSEHFSTLAVGLAAAADSGNLTVAVEVRTIETDAVEVELFNQVVDVGKTFRAAVDLAVSEINAATQFLAVHVTTSGAAFTAADAVTCTVWCAGELISAAER